MSPITARARLARASVGVLAAVALVAGPATSALADPTPDPSATPTAPASPSPSATPSATPTPSTEPSPSTSPSPSATASPSATPTPSASATATPSAPAATLVPGGRARTLGPQAAPGAATSTDPTLVGAHYLAAQLAASGHVFTVDFGGTAYPDYGVTADAVIALDAAGAAQDEAALATAQLANHVVDYVGFGDPTEIAAGAVAKLLNVAVAQGVDPRAFGGTDLVATLEARENAQGRFADQSQYGDNSNTFGQSFALVGLHRAGRPVSSQAVAYLLAQQCPGGAFKLYMTDTGCTTDTDADPDATAMAVQALIAVGGHATEAGRGLDYLAGRQAASGGVGGGGPTSGVNANSTGLAAQAFLAGGRTAQARSAVSFLTGLQYGCTFPVALRGGVAYDSAAYTTARTAGSGATPNDQDRRSTSQALLALAGVPLGAVTAAGASADAPALTCAAPSATPTTTPSVTPTTTAGAGGGGSTTDPVATVPTGALAQTGSNLLWPVAAGLVLVLLGALAVAASRRRGVHA